MRREMEEMKRKMEALEKKNERLIRKVEKMENKEVSSWEEWWRLENTRAEEAARELVEGGSGEIGTIVVIQEDQAMPNELMKIINLQSQDWTVEKEELDRDRIEKDFKRIQRKVKEMFDPAQETEFWEKRFLAKGKGDSKAEWTEKGMRNMWFAVLPVWRLVMLLQRDTSGLVNVELLVEAMRVSMEKSWLIWSEQQQRAEILRSCPSQLRFETNFVDQVIKAKMSWEKKMERVEREIARLERERGNNVLSSAIRATNNAGRYTTPMVETYNGGGNSTWRGRGRGEGRYQHDRIRRPQQYGQTQPPQPQQHQNQPPQQTVGNPQEQRTGGRS